MLCTLYHDVKCTTSMLLSCNHSIYLTHAFHISCLLDALRNFSNDFPQVRTIAAIYQSLITKFYFTICITFMMLMYLRC
jgi:hypothetical protein